MRYLSFTRHLRSWQAFCISALWIVSLRPLQPQIHGGLFSHTANLIRVSTSFSVPSSSPNALFMQCLRTRSPPSACALLNNINRQEEQSRRELPKTCIYRPSNQIMQSRDLPQKQSTHAMAQPGYHKADHWQVQTLYRKAFCNEPLNPVSVRS